VIGIGVLGKAPARIDPRTLRLAPYLTQIIAPPFARDWGLQLAPDLGLYRNDQIGDCTCVAAAHLQRLWSSCHGAPVEPSVDEVVAAYSAVSGYRPSDPTTDRGADMLAVLKHWRNVGIAGRRARAFVKLDHESQLQVMTAINLFGGIYVGAMLPRAVAAVLPFTWWDLPSNGRLEGDARIGSWGGHCMAALGYSRLGVLLATWGRRQWVTWGWFTTYCDEAYGVLDDLWSSPNEPAPNGLDVETLERDVAAIRGVP
jgi:hypothetical protein